MEEAMSIDFDSLAQLTFQQKVCLFFLFFFFFFCFLAYCVNGLCIEIVWR